MNRKQSGARPGMRISFRLPNGKIENGFVLWTECPGIMVGVENKTQPTVILHKHIWSNGELRRVSCKTPNRSLWVVPYSHVVQVGEWVDVNQ